jgi:N-ethylmaleimide reductase
MLFDRVNVGDLSLANRIVMAPMTRCRAGQPDNVATAITARYYAQRSSAGLIISEGSQVAADAVGYLWTPGIHSDAQVAGWRVVADAVHEAGGSIFLQAWHTGRISHQSLLPENLPPLGPTDQPANSQCFGYSEEGQPTYLTCSTPRAASTDDLLAVIDHFRQAARRAVDAGIDGIEIHAANGYLFDQFLNGGLNDRGDEYGGSIENRARLLLATVDAVAREIGPTRIGVRLSPHGRFNDMPIDSEADSMALYLASALSSRGIAYLHLVDPVMNGYSDGESLLRSLRDTFHAPLIACGEMDLERAERYLTGGMADLIGFGRAFIANPDLPHRLEQGLPLAAADESTFYGGGEEGYTDYPPSQQQPDSQ